MKRQREKELEQSQKKTQLIIIDLVTTNNFTTNSNSNNNSNNNSNSKSNSKGNKKKEQIYILQVVRVRTKNNNHDFI